MTREEGPVFVWNPERRQCWCREFLKREISFWRNQFLEKSVLIWQNIPTKYGLIWYSTSILGSWNSHWWHGKSPVNGDTVTIFNSWKEGPLQRKSQGWVAQVGSFQCFWRQKRYPLVNIQKTMENHHFYWVNQLFPWPFSIATVCNKLPGRVLLDFLIHQPLLTLSHMKFQWIRQRFLFDDCSKIRLDNAPYLHPKIAIWQM